MPAITTYEQSETLDAMARAGQQSYYAKSGHRVTPECVGSQLARWHRAAEAFNDPARGRAEDVRAAYLFGDDFAEWPEAKLQTRVLWVVICDAMRTARDSWIAPPEAES